MSDDTTENHWDLYVTQDGSAIKTHGEAVCTPPCALHSPSEHHMRDWPLTFDPTRLWLGLRTCEHEFAHPDPDSVTYLESRLTWNILSRLMTHPCDDCCISGDGVDTYHNEEEMVNVMTLHVSHGCSTWEVNCDAQVDKLIVRLLPGVKLEVVIGDEEL